MIITPLGIIDDVEMINLLCSGNEPGILYGKTSVDFKAFLCKSILEPLVKSDEATALCSTGIRPEILKKKGAEGKTNLLRY